MILLSACLGALIWAGLLLAHAGFWRADIRLPGAQPVPADGWPEVVAVIPARNEAAQIGAVIRAHQASTYPGALTIVVVDDGSTDGTGRIARGASGGPRAVHVLDAPPLPPGWTGKLWALETGLRAARGIAPGAGWVLLTDADIVLAPDTLPRLMALVRARGLAMASLMARLDDRGLWGGLLVPAFVFFFQKLYPFARVNDPGDRIAGAAGGCVLLDRAELERIGGIGAIRGALIDDCALAARIKHGPPGHRIWLGLARGAAVSLRDNRSLGSVWAMVRRTAFAQLRHSPVLLAGTVAGMALVYLAGPLAVLGWPWHGQGWAALAGGTAWGLMVCAFAPTLRLYGRPAWQGAGLPLAALLYAAMTLDSACVHWLGRGAAWKGRSYGSG